MTSSQFRCLDVKGKLSSSHVPPKCAMVKSRLGMVIPPSIGNPFHSGHTVDGRNPAPVHMENLPSFTVVYTSQVVQDFFHQQYYSI